MSNFESWTTEQLVKQLNSNGFQESSSCFSRHEITGDLLPLMEDDHLKEIGISNVGQRLHIMKWILKLTENSSASINYGSQPPSKNFSSTKSSSPSPSKSRNLNNSTSNFSSSGTLPQTYSPASTSKPTTSTTKTRQSASKPTAESNSPSKSSRSQTASSENQENVPKCKRDHDKMVEQIRAARKYAAYQKAVEEGRAVGPPPELPPIEEPPDLVQCPHCGRKFGEEQARRHIPNCQSSSFSNQNRSRKNYR